MTPPNLFSVLNPKAQTLKPYFGADGSEIANYGDCTVSAVLDDATPMTTTFNVAKVTRPLLSVTQMTQNGHTVVFGKNESYIMTIGSRKKIRLRRDGQLWMLDMWVKVPAEIVNGSPFARQVAPA